MTLLVSEILLLSKTAKFPFWTMDYSPWSSKNLIDQNRLKKFMQVGVDVTYMHADFGGCGLFGFDCFFFKQQIKNSSIGHTLARVHMISCTLNTSIVNIELLLILVLQELSHVPIGFLGCILLYKVTSSWYTSISIHIIIHLYNYYFIVMSVHISLYASLSERAMSRAISLSP